MAVAMISAITKVPVLKDVAMTGEITLRGNVLSIGGLTEKLLAARRSGIKKVLLPGNNKKDLNEIPSRVIKGLDLVFVHSMSDVLQHAFLNGFSSHKNVRNE
jgi:ATP-dependent Lon protease